MTRFTLSALLLALILVACSVPTGSLQIDVLGLPAGEEATIRIAGPNGYNATVTESTTLTGLTPGSYALTAATLTTSEVITDYVPVITPDSVEVTVGETATATVEFAPRGGTLAIIVSGLPAGLDADVSLTGPDGFAQSITEDTVLTVDPGTYSATANSVTDGTDTFNPSIPDATAEVSSSRGADIEIFYERVVGSLEITIDGLPGPLDADVSVQGPGGFATVVTTSTTLTDLTPGTYTLAASPILVTSNLIVSRAFAVNDALPATVEVPSGATATASTSYAVQPSSGRLWTPHVGATIVSGFAAADLGESGSPTPAARLTGTIGVNEGMAFDSAGNAWISNITTDTLELYLAADLASDGSPPPSITIAGMSNPRGVAFDAAGNLWVANSGNSTVVAFAPDQLLASGSPTPSVTISNNAGSIVVPSDLAFDAAGNLWVANFEGDTVVRFGASQLQASGSPAPELILGDDGDGNLDDPNDLTFDAAGNLWIANDVGPEAILKFEDPGALTGAVAPTADVILTGVIRPNGIAFDNSGSLWTASFDSGTLWRFDDLDSLSGAVTPTAAASIDSVAPINFGLIAFYPPAEGLPITTP